MDASGELTDQEIERLQTTIRDTHRHLQHTVGELQRRLHPRYLKQQARRATFERVRQMMDRAGAQAGRAAESTRNAATSAARRVRGNPMPYALLGAGLAAIAVFAGRRRASRSEDTYAGHDSIEGDTGSTSGITSDQARARAREARERARQAASRARDRWDGVMQDSPLALGLAALAAGALIGAAFPATGVENEYLGTARDRVLDTARAMAEERVERL